MNIVRSLNEEAQVRYVYIFGAVYRANVNGTVDYLLVDSTGWATSWCCHEDLERNRSLLAEGTTDDILFVLRATEPRLAEVFDRHVRLEQPPSKPTLRQAAEENRKVQERLKTERAKANSSVLKSYRIK